MKNKTAKKYSGRKFMLAQKSSRFLAEPKMRSIFVPNKRRREPKREISSSTKGRGNPWGRPKVSPGRKGQTEDLWRILLGIVILISVLLLFAVFLAKISGDKPLLTTSSGAGGISGGGGGSGGGSGVSITGSGGDIVVG